MSDKRKIGGIIIGRGLVILTKEYEDSLPKFNWKEDKLMKLGDTIRGLHCVVTKTSTGGYVVPLD